MSVKQLLSKSGFISNLLVEEDPTVFTSLHPWYALPPIPELAPVSVPRTYTQYFTSAFAYCRGSTRYSSMPFSATAFQEVVLVPDQAFPDSLPFGTTGYITEQGPLHFIVPFYSDKSRVRVSSLVPSVAAIALRSGIDGPASRLLCSAGDDSQLGFFLSAPPLLRRSADTSLSSPFAFWQPTMLSKTSVSFTEPVQTESLIKVNDAYGIPTPVTADTQSSFTVFHTGNMAWDGSSWTRVGGNGVLSVTVPTPVPVVVTNPVDVIVPDNTPVLIRGLDASSNPQTFAALPNVDGNHVISASVQVTSVVDGSLNPVSAASIVGGVVALLTNT